MAPTRLCIICKAVEGKYRCPQCDEFTCALACSKEHRASHPAIEEKPKPLNAINTIAAPQPGVSPRQPPSALSELADSAEYKTLVQRYPGLEGCLWSIATATDPPKPGQGGFASRKANQSWTSDVGMTNAVQLVQSIKASPGDVRDGLREFSDLVSIFKTRMQVQDEERRRLRAQEDAQIINGLLKGEKS